MTEESRRQLEEYVAGFHLPRYRELPDIGLRLEQLTRYTSRYVPTPLTGSMVSNYVKQHLIPGPVKKPTGRNPLPIDGAFLHQDGHESGGHPPDDAGAAQIL